MSEGVPRGTPQRAPHSWLPAALDPSGLLQGELRRKLRRISAERCPPQSPWLSSFCVACEPDYPPPTLCGSGSPARNSEFVVIDGAGAGSEAFSGTVGVVACMKGRLGGQRLELAERER